MDSSTLKLIILQGPRKGETLCFETCKLIRIGRIVRGNTVPIKDSGISTKHLSIEFELGKWMIEDLDSSNGTLLNDSKLPPFAPTELHQGDEVKIGEYTSIRFEIAVLVQAHGEDKVSVLRRNSRRNAGVHSVEKDLGRRGQLRSSNKRKGLKDDEVGLGSVIANPKEGLDSEAPVKRKRGRAAEVQRSNVNDTELSSISEVQDESVGQIAEDKRLRCGLRRGRALKGKELKNDEEVMENKLRRGRPPRGAKKTNNTVVANSSTDLLDLPNIAGCPYAAQLSNVEKSSEAYILLPKIEEMTISEAHEEGSKQKMNLQDEAPNSEAISPSEENVDRNDLESQEELLEAATVGASKEKDIMEQVNLEPERELASTSGAKKSYVNVSDDVDLEKMTLGQWLDFLEVYLPKQIYNETEELLAKMEEKAKRFHEFMVQQKNGQGLS